VFAAHWIFFIGTDGPFIPQAWIGGECVYVLLCAMFPSTANIPNGIPNSGTDTGHFLGFFLFSALSLVAIWYPLHQVSLV
jgi:NCS1 family nucleobase:cation symporter-1